MALPAEMLADRYACTGDADRDDRYRANVRDPAS
jgi:hypothetical protein